MLNWIYLCRYETKIGNPANQFLGFMPWIRLEIDVDWEYSLQALNSGLIIWFC